MRPRGRSRRCPAVNARERKKRIGSIGSGARSSHATNAAASTALATSEATTSRLPQPGAVAAHESPHEPERRTRDEHETGDVDRRIRAVALADLAPGERDHEQAERDVDPEDPLPREALGDRAADDRPARDGEARDAEVDAERLAPLLGREGRAHEGESQRHDERRADALHGARGDQRLDARRERTGRRSRDEERDAEREQPPPAEAVAERGAGQEEHGEAQVVRVDRPLELRDRCAEVAADRAQRRRHDERVERDHQRGNGGKSKNPSRMQCVCHLSTLRPALARCRWRPRVDGRTER